MQNVYAKENNLKLYFIPAEYLLIFTFVICCLLGPSQSNTECVCLLSFG